MRQVRQLENILGDYSFLRCEHLQHLYQASKQCTFTLKSSRFDVTVYFRTERLEQDGYYHIRIKNMAEEQKTLQRVSTTIQSSKKIATPVIPKIKPFSSHLKKKSISPNIRSHVIRGNLLFKTGTLLEYKK